MDADILSFKGAWSSAATSPNTELGMHYDDVIMTMLASQITSLTVVYSIVYSGVNQRKHQSSASLAIVRAIHRGPVNFPHKWPVTRKMFPFDDVIMVYQSFHCGPGMPYGDIHLEHWSLIPKSVTPTAPSSIDICSDDLDQLWLR